MVEPLALWVTPVARMGGVARHVMDVARHGLPGYRLVVLCPEGALADELRAEGVAVLTGSFGPDAAARPWVCVLKSVATLGHAIGTLRPRVVHSHLAYADIIAAAVVVWLKVRFWVSRGRGGRAPLLVSTEHGISGDSRLYHSTALRAWVAAAVHTARLRVTDVKIAVAEATARTMIRRWSARGVVVIPNGAQRRLRSEARPQAPAGPRVLSLSRLSREKGLSHLVEAFDQVRQRYPHATLTLAGEGPQYHGLMSMVRGLSLGDSVSMPGFVSAPQTLASHDVVVQLSCWENCSYTLLDAVTAGLGVVATDVGGNGEILPAKCLVEPTTPDFSAVVAQRIGAQYTPQNRPSIARDWPTVAHMCSRIVGEYWKEHV